MLSHYSVRKPYTVFVSVIIILILGVVSFMNIHTDLLPSINLPYSIIITPYVGASPESVEAVVTKPIEQSMASISNIKKVQSVSRENLSMVILEFSESTNMDSVVIEMRESLDLLRQMMPEGVGSSNIMKLNPDMMPVMVLSASIEGQSISESSSFLENKIIPEIESIEGVASVSSSGLIENEIHVILNEAKIEQVNQLIKEKILSTIPKEAIQMGLKPEIPKIEISKDMITGILKGQNFSFPAGYITEDGVDYMIRTGDKIESYSELEALPVMIIPIEGIAPIVLKDVAEIAYVDNSAEMYSKVNGIDAVTLTVQKQTEYVTSDISNRIHEKMKSLSHQYQDLRMVTLMDQGEYIDIVMNSLQMNLIVGGLLAIGILLLFLRDFKPTIIVGVAIPISLIGTFVLMYFSDITLNIISMGGLALGVGMLVDNSIVVIENIYRMRNEGKTVFEASTEGAKQVTGAIAASTFTTIAVFVPIVFIEGFTREIFADMGLTIAYSLLASLAVALTLVPSMASKMLVKDANKDHHLFEALKQSYIKLLKSALNHKVLVICFVISLLLGSVYGALQMGTELFPAMDSGELSITMQMPQGTRFDTLKETADHLTEKIMSVSGVESVGASVGGNMFSMGQVGGGQETTVSFYVSLNEEREQSIFEIQDQIQTLCESDAYELTFSGTDMNMGALTGSDISIEIKGREFETMEKMAMEIASILESVKGTTEISSGVEETAPELKITVNKEQSIQYGLTVAQVFAAVNQAIATESVATSLTTDEEVIVFNETDEPSIDRNDVMALSIETPTGEKVLIKDIATLSEEKGFKSIRRTDQTRYVTVSAKVDEDFNIGKVSAQVDEALKDYVVPEGYSMVYTGESQTINDTFGDLYLMLLLAVIFIYLIMVAQFQSLLSPFIVMFTIPLAFTGGFLGLIVTGLPISIVAFIGLIVLSGVVVNNGIVFVDYTNKMKEQGLTTYDALIKAGSDRLRPIMMTALTTIIALSTMSFGAGTGTEMMQPMAITTIGGLLYATVLTLFFVPVLYALFHKK